MRGREEGARGPGPGTRKQGPGTGDQGPGTGKKSGTREQGPEIKEKRGNGERGARNEEKAGGGGLQRVLVVGSWAKEHATVVHLQAHDLVEVDVAMEIPNPALLELATESLVTGANPVTEILAFAEQRQPDWVLITTAAPLRAGLADRLEEAGFAVFGASRSASRLEWDKAFARELAQRWCPDVVPRFATFEDAATADAWAADHGWQIAVKPLGLTEGLGVRVAGDQLHGPAEVSTAIGEVLAADGVVLLEERLLGPELAVQALVDGPLMVPTPPVRDFKKLLDGDTGPNTASMGSWTCADGSLPFLGPGEVDRAAEVMRELVAGLQEELGARYRGVLYGQFMCTRDGLRLIELNARPGDPEWLNTLAILDSSLLDAIAALRRGELPAPVWRNQATVVKYLVPLGYPAQLELDLSIEIERSSLDRHQVEGFLSGGLGDNGALQVGSERGVALRATAASVVDAHLRVESAIAEIGGDFHHRSDIGSAVQIREHHHVTPPDAITLRPARERDAAAVTALAASCPPLDGYQLHQYSIFLRHFGDWCWVSDRDNEGETHALAGYVVAMPTTTSPDTVFLWEIAVDPALRGESLAQQLVAQVETRARERGFARVELTVDPTNAPSLRLFERLAYRNVSRREGAVLEVAGQPAARDYYGQGRHFVVLEKQL